MIWFDSFDDLPDEYQLLDNVSKHSFFFGLMNVLGQIHYCFLLTNL